MTDTDITTLVERLRGSIHDAAWKKHGLVQEAADALEALQAKIKRQQADIMHLDLKLDDALDRVEKAETERDAALFDKAVAGGKVRVAEARAALEALQAENERLRAFIIEEGMRSTIQTLNAEERAEKAEAALKEQA